MAASGFKGGLIWIFLVFLNTKHYFYCCQVIKNLKNPKSIVNIIVLAKVSYSIEKSFLNSLNIIFEILRGTLNGRWTLSVLKPLNNVLFGFG